MKAPKQPWFDALLPSSAARRASFADGWPVSWGIIGWFVGIAGSVVGTLLAVGAGSDQEATSALLAGQAGMFVGFVGCAAMASRRFGCGRVLVDFGLVIGWLDVCKSLAIGIALQLIVVPLIYVPFVMFGLDLDVSGPAESLFEDLTFLSTLLIAFGAIVLAPISEELMFRGVLLRGLAHRFGDGRAVWISAAIFATVHFQIVQFPALLVVGLVLGSMAARARSIGPSVWIHVGFNATTVCMLVIQG